MKIILEYDLLSGALTDASSTNLITMVGIKGFPEKIDKSKQSTDIQGIVKLKAAGFSADEIIKLNSAI